MKLAIEQKERRIAVACGKKPELVCWLACGPDGASCFSAETERQVKEWLDGLPEAYWCKDYVPKPLYRWPNYFTDLNACAEMEGADAMQYLFSEYFENLKVVSGFDFPICATAAQRAEAFGRTLGLWKEGE